ncbi:TPA: hypothetical protein JXT23_000798 [Escherichia coli]|uniref:hypothetical protein n=1 Tax=Escherichia coli TaxID=562 RepID=UPI000509D2F6|nr:hypothetical protein [Escherichia coli]EET0749902.1 hypothetical protein [Escherichia coli]EET4563624.1 hypothetical protein [Escherichia coli]EET5101570.1 hypothetical protein [Escherichia coli]EFA9232417.1 hypothetical protein [Escherichia coli]EFB3674611.1 hypothetical protein [Escherichia coli]
MALVGSYDGEINLSQTKTALHRTRLRFLDLEIFSVLFFYKPDRQTAPLLAALQIIRTEMIEKNFSVFHFHGSVEDRIQNVTSRKIRGNNFFVSGKDRFCFLVVFVVEKPRPDLARHRDN